MKTGRIEWHQIGHNASNLDPQKYPSQAEAEAAAKQRGKNVYRMDYHGVVGEEPSAANQGRALE